MSTPAHDLVDSMLAAWNAGRHDQVIALAGQSATAEADERVLVLLGLAQQQTGCHTQAIETFTRLSRMRPEVSAYWNNLGVACRHGGDFDASERALSKARSLSPGDAEVHYNLGLLHVQQRRWLQARQALLEAVQLSPRFVEARLQAAYACHVSGDSNGEEAMLEGAGDWPPQPAEQALILAGMLSASGQLEAALKVLTQARLPGEPAAESMRVRIAAQRVALYERNNQLAQARRELQHLPLEAPEETPGDADQARVDVWRAHAVVAMREGRHAEAAALYHRILGRTVGIETRTAAAFGLAAASDRQSLYREAWQAARIAHVAQIELARETAPEVVAPDSQPLPMVTRSVDADTYARWKPLAGPSSEGSPVFVIGFPRSGTTLLEQMLDAHPGFRSMGERGYVYELIERMELAGQRYPADLANLGQTEADQLRSLYDRMVSRALPDLGQRRLVDKNPLNMLCLPMILRLFPAARIILCLRHPCDVLLSCSMQPFRSPAFMVLSSSLQRLARGYADAFQQCCRHLDLFAPQILEWRYESVVSDFPGAVACLGQYLEVEDTSPFAEFAEHAGARGFIGTPSYAQVIEPVNRGAVGRWKNYRGHFEPIFPQLRPWLDRFGYDG